MTTHQPEARVTGLEPATTRSTVWGHPEPSESPKSAILRRFLGKVRKDARGCWLWTGATQSRGYGSFGIGAGRTALAHRVSFELHRGPIPAGLTIDHLCRVRRCVRPDHLEPVPMRVNLRRGFGAPAVNARKTHCLHGHALGGENLRLRPDGRRQCRTCQREHERVRNAARRSVSA